MAEIVKSACGSHTYKPKAFRSHKDHMLALLKRDVPPGEELDSKNGIFRPFDAVGIVNAGWLFYEQGFPTWGERFKKLDSVAKLELLNRLLTKALEISFVKEAESYLKGRGR